MGGIHRFMRWDRPVLTDSGGYQIFSLPKSRRISEEGAVFSSYVNGESILLSPERSIAVQRSIGSDIMMVLDECVPSDAPFAEVKRAVELTQRWAARSLTARGDSPQALFAIVQGALFPELRRRSAGGLLELPFDGYALGGLAVGESKAQREDTCEYAAGLLPEDRPRYLMGVGTPLDVLEAVHRGIDMMDCVIPTKVARRGLAYSWQGTLEMRRGVYRVDPRPLDERCGCPACQGGFSRAYLHHLTKTQEVLGWQLIGLHNLWFYHDLMRQIRESVLRGDFAQCHRRWRAVLDAEDADYPVTPPQRKRPVAPKALGPWSLSPDEGMGWCLLEASSLRRLYAKPRSDEESALQGWVASQLESCAVVGLEQGREVDLGEIDLGWRLLALVDAYEQAVVQGRELAALRLRCRVADLRPLQLALANLRHFEGLRHGSLQALVKRGQWCSRRAPGLSCVLEGWQEAAMNE
jgi:queuine tRNA-ribosyltransferase